MGKSKIIVFKNGGKLAKNEKWYFQNKKIDVVGQYKYLGVTITSKASFNVHLKERVTKAKLGLGMLWKMFMENNNVSFGSKLRVFNTVSRSIACYGAQVWGGVCHEEIEKLFRYFIKKLFRLPVFVPSVFIYREVNYMLIFTHTLKLHLDYVLKVFDMPSWRLPLIVARETVTKNIFWSSDINNLLTKYGIGVITANNVSNWDRCFRLLSDSVRTEFKNQFNEKVNDYDQYPIYRELKCDLGSNHYLQCNVPLDQARWIMRARAGMLNLGHQSAFFDDSPLYCELCGCYFSDQTYHYLAVCTRFSELRLKWFGSQRVSGHTMMELLNGRHWPSLANFCKAAYAYSQVC